jgi:hypothetical protein
MNVHTTENGPPHEGDHPAAQHDDAAAAAPTMTGPQADPGVDAREAAAAAAAMTPEFLRKVSSGSSDAGVGGPWAMPSPPRPPPRPSPAPPKSRVAPPQAQHRRVSLDGTAVATAPTPHPTNDALFGRGGRTNNHTGNKCFRELVRNHLLEYEDASKLGKEDVAVKVVGIWRAQDPPGGFLEYDPDHETWNDVGDKKALAKVKQAFRDGRESPKRGTANRAARSTAENEDDGSDDFEPMVRR